MALYSRYLKNSDVPWFKVVCFLIVALSFIGQQIQSTVIQSIFDVIDAVVIQGLVIIGLTFYCIDRLTYWNPFANALALSFFVLAYTFASWYSTTTNAHLDIGLIVANWRLAFTFESLLIVSGLLDPVGMVLLGVVAALCTIFIWKNRKHSIKHNFDKKNFLSGVFALFSVFVLVFGPFKMAGHSTDEITFILRSIYNPHIAIQKLSITKNQRHEFLSAHTQFNFKPPIEKSDIKTQPHIFLILMESFNANFVLTKATNGEVYTPFLNSLISEGMYFDNFYGNSIQTSKGQFSSLCGYLPLVTAKAIISALLEKLDCLPRMMRSAGYETVFIQGYSNLEFESTGSFMNHIGFNEVVAMDANIVGSKIYEHNKWGWGIPDTYTYKEAIKKAKKIKESGKSVFLTLSTISHHVPFNSVPENERYIFPDQSSRKDRFANSIHVADKYLKSFFEELNKDTDLKNNSIIIITGDHSFPAGEHGNYFNEIGAYNENFKVPLLILGENKLIKNGVVESGTFSQVAIKPTVLQLAGIRHKGHYYSSSLFDLAPPVTYLVQPYDGIKLAVIRDQMKYVFFVKNYVEKLFDLKNDPNESNDLLKNRMGTAQKDSAAELLQLRKDLRVIYYNEQFILSK